MKNTIVSRTLSASIGAAVGLFVLLGAPGRARALPKIGEPAPTFKGTDSNGKTHELSQYKGKYVVLEWTNQGCPYVRKHYDSKNMQELQKQWTGKGVVWLSVVTSAGSKPVNAKKINDSVKEIGAAPNATLLDVGGEIGKSYGAQTTPHMFVINPKGDLIYLGAIDDKPTTDREDVKTAKNYVSAALEASMAGKKVAVSSSKSYGCGVHY